MGNAKVFRYRRHPRSGGRGPDLGRFHAAPGPRRRPRARAGAASAQAVVVIGKDTRISGYMFEAALEAGLVAAGADVRMLGPMPTPAVALPDALAARRCRHRHFGLAQSARRQRHQVLLRARRKAGRRRRAGDRGRAGPAVHARSIPEKLGKAARIPDALTRYAEFCKASVPDTLSLARHGRSRSTARMAPPTRWRRRCFPSWAREVDGDRRESGRAEHQRGRRLDASRGTHRPCARNRRRPRHRLRRRRRPRADGRQRRPPARWRCADLPAGPRLAATAAACAVRWSAR